MATQARVPEPICYRFDERKAAAAAGRLLRLAGGRMPYMRLVKLLYLSDRESFLRYNRPITGDRYVAMHYGPVLSRVLELMKAEAPAPGPWGGTIETDRYEVRLVADPDDEPLSEAEITILEEAFRLVESLDQWKLADLTHGLPEWTDPGSSSRPIDPEAILTALGKAPEEIEEARQQAVERAHFQQLFGA